MDSLYEAVQESSEAQVYTIPSRSRSPAVLLDDTTKWKNAARSISMVTIEMTAGMLYAYCTVMGNVSAIWMCCGHHELPLNKKPLLTDYTETIWKYIKNYFEVCI